MTPTYHYRQFSGRHTVGYFTRRGKWRQKDVCWSAASAADRAVYLNGGTSEWSTEATTTWDQIQRETGWQPMRERV